MRPILPRVSLVLALLSLGLSSCLQGRDRDPRHEPRAGAAGETDEAARSGGGDRLAAKERAASAAAAEVRIADLGLDLAQLEAAARVADAEEAVRGAEFERLEAERKQGEFTHGAQLRRERWQLDQTGREDRLLSARADLAGILAIYELAPEADAKDEIVRRHQTAVARAESELRLGEQELGRLNFELEASRRELDEKRRAAEDALRSKRAGLEAALVAARKQVLEAQNKLAGARADVAEAQRKLDDARAETSAGSSESKDAR